MRSVARGAPDRVAAVHHQARRTLGLALGFALAAPAVALVVDDHRRWLGLHLFAVGALLLAISGATQLLAVTWSASPAPHARAVAGQRALLVLGAIGLAVTRPLDAPAWTVVAAGSAVLVALLLLGSLLVAIRRAAVTDRFHAPIDGYLLAVGFGLAGSALGLALATDGIDVARARDAHVTLNLFGLVGTVVAATLPYFAATQLRMRMARHATPVAVRTAVGGYGLGVVLATAGVLDDRTFLSGAGFALAAAGVVGVVALLPRPGRKQLAWGGARVVQLAAGIAWWCGTAVAVAAGEWRGDALEARVLVALAVAGYAQILVASLAYFGPVLRGGGHERLSAGFATTRSWLAVAATNAAGVAILADVPALYVPALAIWVVDTAVRTATLVRRA